MSAKIAVLGLVIEEPGPPHRLTAKLRQRLASAEFVDSNVYSALTRLERDGLVYAIDDASQDDGDGPRADADPGADVDTGADAEIDAGAQRQASSQRAGRRTPGARQDARMFAATTAGVRHFEEWLLGSSSAPPLRDDLHLKVALCQPHNVPRLIELVRGQELVCLTRVQDLKRSFARLAPPTPDRWAGLVLVHVRDAELSYWQARLTWLQGVRDSLERMRAACGDGQGDRNAAPAGREDGRAGARELAARAVHPQGSPGRAGAIPAAGRARAPALGRYSGSTAGRYPGA